MEKDHVTALLRAVKAAGTQSKLAAKMRESGCTTASQQLISYWLTSKTLIGAEWWAAIEFATDGAVTRSDLRPDVFPRNHAA
jgi:DNA-binding transcriptional regulator YdaS (Cro superfamily)